MTTDAALSHTGSQIPKAGSVQLAPEAQTQLGSYEPGGRDLRYRNLVLVVDDQAENLKLLHQILAQTPYRLSFATSGKQALERVEAIQPDLILLDLFMPGMDGLAVCQQLKDDPKTADIPIIFLTASQDTDHLIKAFDYGAEDYITKPFRAAELLARVRVHLSLREAQSALDGLNQHLERQVQQRTRQLQQALTFADITQRITEQIRATLQETQIFDTVVRELATALNLDRCQIGIYDETRLVSTVAYEYITTLPSTLGQVNRFKDMDLYHDLQKGQVVHCTLPPSTDHGLLHPATFLACPLQDESRVIGDIWLYRLSAVAFSENEIRLIRQVADQTAIAIRQARLYSRSQQQVQELERLNYAKDDFLSTLSHELRTPLTTIKAAADTLQMLLHQEPWTNVHLHHAQRATHYVLEGCEREIKLVNTLLEFVHLNVNQAKVVCDLFQLEEVVNNITPLFKERLRQQQQTLTVSIAEGLPPLSTNAEVLTSILVELLDNACKYTPAGGKIELVADYGQNRYQIQVSNSGVTLTETELLHIFDKFYRLPRHDRWQHGGVGLGLALVKKQMEYLGGQILAIQTPEKLIFNLELDLED